jgi:hypothetical protein
VGAIIASVCLVLVGGIPLSGARERGLNTTAIEQLTGTKGELSEKEGVFKVSVPRTDLQVIAAGVKMTPPLGLTSWAAFQSLGV